MCSALIFWALFGWLAEYSFPFGESIQLLLSCFHGTVSNKVNKLQKQLQDTEFISQINNKEQIKKLNNLDFQAWLYIEVLDKLGKNEAECHKKITKTIEILKQKKAEILEELEPRRPKNYRLFKRIHNFFQDGNLTRTEKELNRIDKILNDLVCAAKKSSPSPDIIQDLLNDLYLAISQNAENIHPKKIGLLYKVGELLNLISKKEISRLDRQELDNYYESTIKELKSQIKVFSTELKKLLQEKYVHEQELQRLNKVIAEGNIEIAKISEEVKHYREQCKSQNSLVDNLQHQLNVANQKLKAVQTERKSILNRNNQLIEDINQKQSEISSLIDKYSAIRPLEGKYIGNISNKSSKYHFSEKCPDWKMLVAEYVLDIDGSREMINREIINRSQSNIFRKNGLEACQFCANQRKNKKKK
ncbi:hypothetical protein [Dapis sp. BLCC M229]|uniref:hypothetical protein n=1 Tax=Dapis sp. BLCC M229 TaxID=3400188 RepID=UPI003CEF21DB